MQGRNAAIDAVRVVGMLAIVAGHVWLQPWARTAFYTWHVPLFFFLSGYLWKPSRPFGRDAMTRVRTLLVPYAVWVVVVGAVAFPLLKQQHQFSRVVLVQDVLVGPNQGTPFWAFWFVVALFYATVAYRLLERIPLPAQWAVAIAGVVLAAGLPGRPLLALPFGIEYGLVGLFFVVAGRTFALYRARITRPVLFGAISVCIGFALAIATPGSYIDVKALSLGTPVCGIVVSILISLGLVLLGEGLLAGIRNRVAALITRTALGSLVVLFVHVPILWLLGDLGGNGPVGFVATVGISWAIAFGLLALPHTWVFTGNARARSSASRPARFETVAS